MKAKSLNNWNIVRIVETGTIGIIRNDCLPENMKRHVCVQLQDKTAVVISGNSEVELYKDLPEIVYEALANINAAQQGVQRTDDDAPMRVSVWWCPSCKLEGSGTHCEKCDNRLVFQSFGCIPIMPAAEQSAQPTCVTCGESGSFGINGERYCILCGAKVKRAAREKSPTD